METIYYFAVLFSAALSEEGAAKEVCLGTGGGAAGSGVNGGEVIRGSKTPTSSGAKMRLQHHTQDSYSCFYFDCYQLCLFTRRCEK